MVIVVIELRLGDPWSCSERDGRRKKERVKWGKSVSLNKLILVHKLLPESDKRLMAMLVTHLLGIRSWQVNLRLSFSYPLRAIELFQTLERCSEIEFKKLIWKLLVGFCKPSAWLLALGYRCHHHTKRWPPHERHSLVERIRIERESISNSVSIQFEAAAI